MHVMLNDINGVPTLFMVFNARKLFAKGLDKGFKVSHLLIANMILSINISNLLK